MVFRLYVQYFLNYDNSSQPWEYVYYILPCLEQLGWFLLQCPKVEFWGICLNVDGLTTVE